MTVSFHQDTEIVGEDNGWAIRAPVGNLKAYVNGVRVPLRLARWLAMR